jgi:hypothetical protein
MHVYLAELGNARCQPQVMSDLSCSIVIADGKLYGSIGLTTDRNQQDDAGNSKRPEVTTTELALMPAVLAIMLAKGVTAIDHSAQQIRRSKVWIKLTQLDESLTQCSKNFSPAPLVREKVAALVKRAPAVRSTEPTTVNSWRSYSRTNL